MNESVIGSPRRLASRFANYRWIPWLIVGLFVIVIAVNAGLVYFAAESWPGLTTDHAYNEGLEYNRVIDEASKEAKLGWKVDLSFTRAPGTGGGTLAVVARDASGAPLDNLALEGELVRPVEQMPNIPLKFAAQGEGHYLAVLDLPRLGQWDIYLVARRGRDTWHGGERIVVADK